MNGKKKVGIIGIGNVGMHVASSIVDQGLCDELVLLDCKQEKADSNAADLSDALPYLPQSMEIYGGTYEDLADADILVISAATGLLTEDRLKELDATVAIMGEIAPQIVKSGFHGIILSISNPCDLIAQLLEEKTGIQTIGTGTMLDTARLRMILSRKFKVSPHSVHGYVLGEHGDSQMVPWSMVNIGGIPVADWAQQFEVDCDWNALADQAMHAGWQIVKGKGCTEFGIGASCAMLVKSIFLDEKKVWPVSVCQESEKVFASVPCVIGRNGVEHRISLKLTAEEEKLFKGSCQVLRNNKKFSG